MMTVFDDIYSWQGWGGKLKLGSGKCRLRIYNLKKENPGGLTFIRPIIVMATDVKESKMSIRSCAGHIATTVTQQFDIDPSRMLWIEYYPASSYGTQGNHLIAERFEAVEFEWQEGKAIKPTWRVINPPMLDELKKITQDWR